jgi:hypothetical protein
MLEKRVKFSNIVRNQLPDYVKEEFPLVVEFLSQYYISQEYSGSSADLIQNIDQYIKLDNIVNTSDSVTLLSNISIIDDVIKVDLLKSPTGTNGFPDKYGIIKIDDEIVTYTEKTFDSFKGCIRGFSGITSYKTSENTDELVFSESFSEDHVSGSIIFNLSYIFLKEFLLKIKKQITPGFENRTFDENLNESLFIKQSKDFYSSKGTDRSFEILFKSLYGENSKIIRPREYLFRPSDAQYQITRDLIVESVEGNPEELLNSTLKQDEYFNYSKAYAPVAKVGRITSNDGKEYYKLSIDANYDKDLNVNGSLYGNFDVHASTKIIGEYDSNSTAISVDSTIGFPESGELYVRYNDNTEGIIFYRSKSLNQFFECSNINGIIEDSSDIWINTYAYGSSTNNTNEIIKVRITSVIKDINLIDETYSLKKDYDILIKTLGVKSEDLVTNNWIFNISPSYGVESISLINDSNKTYRVNLKSNHSLRIGDNIDIRNSSGDIKKSVVIDVISEKSFLIRGQGDLLILGEYVIKRSILKSISPYFSEISRINSNIQNVYVDGEKTLVSSPSIPNYYNQNLNAYPKRVTFSGFFDSDTFKITSGIDHGFYTGDVVYYTPEKIIEKSEDGTGQIVEKEITLSKLFDEGIYYVKRINSNTIKLSRSKSDTYQSKFISVDSPVTIKSNIIEIVNFNKKTLKTQKLLREISSPINDGIVYSTEPGFTGILINGTEILNYKSSDVIYYNSIEKINVPSLGSDYDVLNPPILSISDLSGIGAEGYCSVKGSLKEIRIIDPGFDYTEVPTIKITGGNGIGAKAHANMKSILHKSIFNSEEKSNQVSLVNGIIGFTTYHKFKNNGRVIYRTNNQTSVGGLSTDSSYYISVQSPVQIKLHRSFEDSLVGINTIQFTSYGVGSHELESFETKLAIGSIVVENGGLGYENKKRSVSSSIVGINTSINEIKIQGHDFNTGEIVKYYSGTVSIGGLNDNQEYFITKINNDSFKLSQIGTGNVPKDFYLNTGQYTNLQSVGLGTHYFNYPEINVEIEGILGVSTEFKSIVQPIFRGEITSVHLENGGIGYGSSEILNYNRQPNFSLNVGFGAKLVPIISDGKISQVIVDYSGNNYNSPPDLKVIGDGFGAKLTPIIEDGKLVEVKVIESGIGYKSDNTNILVTTPGSSAKFLAEIQKWSVNIFQKNLNIISDDDGFISEGINPKYELEYAHVYAPRKLREILYASDQDGNILYSKEDLRKISNREVVSTDHSPIIGWAYDGNPIYGPYGYITSQGGSVVQMKSGYKIDLKPNRPPFPEGFFIEDYKYFDVSDETTLDEHNGRFCVTPEYPNGTYAYFATISQFSADNSGPFSGYKSPIFPYLIGNLFKSKPNQFNFEKSSNQDEINLNDTKWIRNTNPYNLIEDDLKYSYLNIPNNLNQISKIEYAEPGSIDDIVVIFGGTGYKVDDELLFNSEGTQGYNVSSKIETIGGKEVNAISVASTIINDVEIYPTSKKGSFILNFKDPHGFKFNDIVNLSGLSTDNTNLESSYKINVSINQLFLTSGIGSTSSTGIVTYFPVSSNLSLSNIRENDIFGIGEEFVKILNVDFASSRIKVLREFNGSISTSYNNSEILYEIPRTCLINSNSNFDFNFKPNKEIYFNPSESVGIGTSFGIGIGVTLTFSNPGAGITEIFIPTKTIYIPNHQLQTGDELVYSTNGGNSIGVSTNGISTSVNILNQSIVYVAKITDNLIGISTFKVGLGSEGSFVGISSETNNLSALYFTNFGSGENHSFTTKYESLTAKVSRNLITVITKEDHNLSDNDKVFVNVNPSTSTSITLKYNDYNKKILINPKDFNSIDVNIDKNSIKILDHGFKNGEKIIHTSVSPSGGLSNNGEYYVFVIDKDNFKLAETYYGTISDVPSAVGITSSSYGTISLINPSINLYEDSIVTFNLSDSSLSYLQGSNLYPAFKLEFFSDSNFTKNYFTNSENRSFNIKNVGVVGITTNASAILTITKNTPKTLYYNLIPIYDENIPEVKKLISIDFDVLSNNKIQIKNSGYNGEHPITVGTTTTFTYTLENKPESNSYNSISSIIKYDTNSKTGIGSITKVKILDGGKNYYSFPLISSIRSVDGNNAILELFSDSIGRVKKTRITDIGFDFPSDFTLKPSLGLPQIVKIDPLSSFESIDVVSFGRGYITPPKLVVLDGKTNKVIPEVDLKVSFNDTKVKILNNTFGLNDAEPKIIPINNSNGVGISSIQYNSITKDVTVYLSVGFSTANSFPFIVGDRVLIENISVGINSDAKGFNSENYNYELFTINSIDENLGGFGSISYGLSGLIKESEIPGTFDSRNSSGRIIPEKYFPVFKSKLNKNNYLIGESVRFGKYSGIVNDWDFKTSNLKILSKNDIKLSDIIIGRSSRTQGITSSIKSFNAFYNLDSTSRIENGWKLESGFLNNNIQRIQDSFYYQNFSYSIKSKVTYDDWNDVVSTLNHTLGYKKFSDYQLETKLDEKDSSSLVVGLSDELSSIEIVNDIIGVVNLNCVYDFDLVRENALRIGERIFSDEIIFSNKILVDHIKSIGNRVLSIDDISSQFNSNPRPSRFSEVNRFDLFNVRSQKYITYVRDKRFTNERQVLIVSSLIDDIGNTYLNQYARIENTYDMGSFDLSIDGTEGVLLFYPTKFSNNDFDITTLSYNIDDDLSSIGNTNFGGVIDIQSGSVSVSSGSTTTIVGIATTYRAAKILVSISGNNGKYEYDELSIIHDGSDVELLEYGQLTNHSLDTFSNIGLGTYYSYISGSQLIVDFIPNVGVSATINTIKILFGFDSIVGVGTYEMKHARIEGRSTNISSSSSPPSTIICESPDICDAGYIIIQVSDLTNNIHQISEIVLLDSETEGYITEYAVLSTDTNSGLGTIGFEKLPGINALTFTPLPDIDVNVKVYSNALRYRDDDKDVISFLNSEIETNYGTYEGTETDIKRSFNLTHKNNPIFERYFEGDNSQIVDINNNSIIIPNHFFVSGELVKYDTGIFNSENSIGIGTTSFTGIGITDKLPKEIYVVKVSENVIKLAESAEDALNIVPKTLDIVSVGVGTTHRIISTNQNAKVLLAIDNLIQSPVVATSVTTTLVTNVFTTDDILYFTGITSFFGGDLIRIEDEIMRIEGVGIGSTNGVRVRRPWLGTALAGYSTSTLVTKVNGDYNIVNNVINFVSAPYGNIPFSSITNPPDERDWVGISTGSKFQGRSFMRSGIVNSIEETYTKNYIFDDISSEFNGISKEFTLKSNRNNVTDIEDKNAIILVNNLFQAPGLLSYNYTLSESSGITSIRFTGSATSVSYDVNNGTIPRGGIIVSVGSTEGFGYQPLVSAGGTAIVSIAGTISSISIGNSGSGYRGGVQIVNVGVGTSSTGIPNIEFIGTAVVSNGHVVSIAITNPGAGYTSNNPPFVVFDDPLSYSNIPLIYSSGSSGFGTEAKIDIVVSQGSNIIDFEISNTGYGYNKDDVLTIPIGGNVGIPTTGNSFEEFQISIQDVYNDKFSGWSIGELQLLDKLDNQFDGNKTTFLLTLDEELIPIHSARGSNINIQDTMLVFINDILQEPGKGYLFSGGSVIRFTEPPKSGDTSKILFYRGSGSVDVVDVDILETVKVGDELTIDYDPSIGQSPSLKEESRTVTKIKSTDLVNTNPYFGPGNVDNENLERPVIWCRQTEDKIINEQEIAKDRILYEAIINPTSYLIQPVGIGSTIIYVDNIRPFFNQINENQPNESNTYLEFQNKVTFISQKSKVSASGTAIVSVAGTISSIQILDGGNGYITNPSVVIQNSVGIGTTLPVNAIANAVISSGIVTSITISNPGVGYTFTNSPIVIIEPPSFETEIDDVNDYEGDSGIIVGISTGSIGVASTAIIFDLYIPENSFLRDSSVIGVTTISGIQTNYYFVIYNSNIGNTTVSLGVSGTIIGIGTTTIDNVYQASSVSIAQTSVIGVGITYVTRVAVSVQNYNGLVGLSTSNFYGEYSWGRISLNRRLKNVNYDSYTLNGVSGLTTGTMVKRTNSLRFFDYIT